MRLLADFRKYFPAAAYNECARLWYEWAKILYNAGEYTNDTDPITQSLGDQLQCEKEWVSKRIFYIASYCMYGAALGGSIEFRQQNRATYNLTTAMKMYVYMQLGTSYRYPAGYSVPKRCEANEVVSIECEGSDSIQTYIVSSEYLKSLGDLSGVGVSGATAFANGKRLNGLKLGDSNASSVKFKPNAIVSFPQNAETIDLRNIGSTLTSIASLASLNKLKNFYCDGTAVSSVILPQTNNLENISLNSSLNTLVLRNQSNISSFSYTPTNLKDLTIGYTNLQEQTFIKNWIDTITENYNQYALNADGINWTNFSAADLVKLSHFGTIILRGTISLDASSITPAQLEEIRQSLGVLLDTGELVLHYRNIITVTITPAYLTATLSTSAITVQALNDNPLYIKFNGEDESDLVEIVNKIDTVTNGRRTITGTIQAKREISTSELVVVSATDNEITSNNFNLVVRPIIHITGVNLSVTSKYFSDLTPKVISAELSPSGYSDIPSFTWEISYLRDTTNYYIDQDEFFYYIKKFSNNDIVVRVPINGGGNYENQCVVQINELVNEHFNDDDLKVRCNVYVNNVLVTYAEAALVLHTYYQPYACQSFDENELNYNPYLMCLFRDNGILDLIPDFYTDNKVTHPDGSYGYFITQQQAAQISYNNPVQLPNTVTDLSAEPICYRSFNNGIPVDTIYSWSSLYCARYFNILFSTGDQWNPSFSSNIPISPKKMNEWNGRQYFWSGIKYYNFNYANYSSAMQATNIGLIIIKINTTFNNDSAPQIIIFTNNIPPSLSNISYVNIQRIIVPLNKEDVYKQIIPSEYHYKIVQYDTENDPYNYIDRYDGQTYQTGDTLINSIIAAFPIEEP